MNECYCGASRTLSGFDWMALMTDLMGFTMVALGFVGIFAICLGVFFALRQVCREIRGR